MFKEKTENIPNHNLRATMQMRGLPARIQELLARELSENRDDRTISDHTYASHGSLLD